MCELQTLKLGSWHWNISDLIWLCLLKKRLGWSTCDIFWMLVVITSYACSSILSSTNSLTTMWWDSWPPFDIFLILKMNFLPMLKVHCYSPYTMESTWGGVWHYMIFTEGLQRICLQSTLELGGRGFFHAFFSILMMGFLPLLKVNRYNCLC